jgi:hypothetical protein
MIAKLSRESQALIPKKEAQAKKTWAPSAVYFVPELLLGAADFTISATGSGLAGI